MIRIALLVLAVAGPVACTTSTTPRMHVHCVSNGEVLYDADVATAYVADGYAVACGSYIAYNGACVDGSQILHSTADCIITPLPEATP